MNELMINIKGGNWIYFRTRLKTSLGGLLDFHKTCEDAGIDISNLQIESVVLRDEYGEKELDEGYKI